jgi:alkanesulfonate monooxygenase SsuD/methylene tetrahydromethanopterin reductase-like flavin-dependent oxidoreductase (luciferase family)
MVGVNMMAADTDAQARRLFTSLQQQKANLRRGMPSPLQPPVDDIDQLLSPGEKQTVDQSLAYSIVGSPERVREGLMAVIAQTGADELILSGHIYDHAARLRSFEIAAQVRDTLEMEPKPAAPALTV